ncbi:MAG: hypothetical protein WKF84_30140 [Pyrinomonadaceae bacterium]
MPEKVPHAQRHAGLHHPVDVKTKKKMSSSGLDAGAERRPDEALDRAGTGAPACRSARTSLELQGDLRRACANSKPFRFMAHEETEHLLAAIPSILIGLNEDLHVTAWNRVAAETLGSRRPTSSAALRDCPLEWNLCELLDKILCDWGNESADTIKRRQVQAKRW